MAPTRRLVPPTTSTTFMLEKTQWRDFRRLAQTYGVTASELIRQLMEAALKEAADMALGQDTEET